MSRDTEADTEPETTESLEVVVREDTEDTPGPGVSHHAAISLAGPGADTEIMVVQ